MERSPIEVFFSYSREDKPLRDKLEIHLSSLRQQGVISSWHDRQIVAGSEWEEEIDRHMKTANIILLLISPDFVASKYCYEIELQKAIARHEAREAHVVPILLRPVARWQSLPFAKLQLYPSGGMPITEWTNQDRAFVDVVEGIHNLVDQLLAKREQERQAQEQQEQEQLRQEQKQEQRRIAEIQRRQAEATEREKQAKRAEEQAKLRAKQAKLEQDKQEEQAREKEQARKDKEKQAKKEREQARRRIEEIRLQSLRQAKRISHVLATCGCIFLTVPIWVPATREVQPYKYILSEVSSRVAEFFFKQGSEKLAKGDNLGAIADFTQAIKVKPDYAFAYNKRGNARSNLDDKQGAIADYTQAINKSFFFAEALYNRGRIYADLGDETKAIADFERAVSNYRLFDAVRELTDKESLFLQIALKRIEELKSKRTNSLSPSHIPLKAPLLPPDFNIPPLVTTPSPTTSP